MIDKLKEIEKNALESLSRVQDEDGLEAWRISHLGRNSPLMRLFAGLSSLSKEDRPAMGQV